MKKILLFLVCLAFVYTVSAQTADSTAKAAADPVAVKPPAPDTTSKPAAVPDTTSKSPVLSITGYADVYYKYNFNQNISDNKTSFTYSHNSFELNMASVKFQETYKNAGFVADLGYGNRAEQFSYNDTDTKMIIKQLNVYYAFTEHFKLSMGSFATHMNYESMDPTGNRNYSMSYAFSFGPFFNTGLKADFTLSSRWTAMVGVFDPNDFKSSNFTTHKYIGAQLAYSSVSTKFKGWLNYIEGKDTFNTQNNQYNLILQYQPNAKFYMVLNEYLSNYAHADGSTTQWNSSALYLTYDFTSLFGLTLRAETFNDPNDMEVFTDSKKFPNGGNIIAFTLSGNFRLGQLTVIPEFRVDAASEMVFTSAGKTPTGTTSNVLLAAYYAF